MRQPGIGHVVVADSAGHAEICEQGVTLVEQDVVGFHVAVDDLMAVCVRQGVGHLAGERQRVPDRQRGRLLQPEAERAALDVRHDVVEKCVDLTGVVKGQDIRVTQAGHDADLAQEALRAYRRCHLSRQHFDRDAALVLSVDGEIDRTHPAAAELTLNRVAARERRTEAGEGT